MRGSTYALLRAVRTRQSPLKYNHRAAWKYHLWPLNWVVGAHRVGCRDALGCLRTAAAGNRSCIEWPVRESRAGQNDEIGVGSVGNYSRRG